MISGFVLRDLRLLRGSSLRDPRGSKLPLVAASCAAFAMWLSLGALAPTDASPGAPRVGLLPPIWWLGVLLTAAVALAQLAPLTRARALPLFFSIVLVLPWLPIPAPRVLLIWTGPIVIAVWAAVLVGCVLAAPIPTRVAGLGFLRDPRRAPVAAAAIALAISSLTAWRVSARLPGGDEPHYLIIAQSLLGDGDLRIENNHTQGDYLAYFGAELRPDYLRRGQDGEIYSIHAPGLPALVAPAFALLGHAGAAGFLTSVSAGATALAWRAGYLVTGSVAAAWFGWAAVALSTPVLAHAFTIYPDALAAALVMLAMMPLFVGADLQVRPLSEGPWSPPASRLQARRWIVSSAALAMLPWLHTRYVVIAGFLGACLVARLVARDRKTAAWFLAIPAASAAAWFAFFGAIYGSFSPASPYGHYTQSAPENILGGLPGLLFDQQFGLIVNAPIYLVALAGVAPLAYGNRRLALELAATVVPYLMVVAAYHMWWGGHSAPARFLVPILLVLSAPAAALWARARKEKTAGSVQALALAALILSILIAGALIIPGSGRQLYNDRLGFAPWLEWASRLVDLTTGLPSFLRDARAAALAVTAIWLALVSAVCLVARRLDRSASRAASMLAIPVLLAAAATAAIGASALFDRGLHRGGGAPTPTAAQTDLLGRYAAGSAPFGVQYSPWKLIPAEAVTSRLRLAASPRQTSRDGALLVVPDLPAGSYRVHVETAAHATGTATLVVGQVSRAIHTWPLVFDGSSHAPYDIRLPVAVGSVLVYGSGEGNRLTGRAALQPLAIDRTDRRLAGGYARRAARYGGFVTYFLDDNAFVEPGGFWLAGESTASLVVTIERPAATLDLFVRNGPIVNRCFVQAGGWRESLALRPGEERLVQVPLPRAMGQTDGTGKTIDAILRLRADSGFRPRDFNLGTNDRRWLGCWFELR